MQSVPIATIIVGLNPVHGEVYFIQHYVIKFVRDLWQVGGFLRILLFPPPHNCNIVESGFKYHKPTKPKATIIEFYKPCIESLIDMLKIC